MMAFRLALAAVALALFSAAASAQQTWLIVGDSIMSAVSGGTSQEMTPFILQSSRNISIRNLSSPGAALGVTDATGYNSAQFTAELARIGGMFSAYNGLIIQAGTNDYGRSIPWSDTVAGLRRILGHAKAMGKKAIVLDPIWRAGEEQPNSIGNTLNTYRYFMYLVCVNEYQGTCHFAHRENTIMGTAAGASFFDAAEIAQGKQLHPNAAGHAYLAQWILSEAGKAGFF